MTPHKNPHAPLKLPNALIQEYAKRRPRSSELFARAQQSFPGGQTRSVTHYEPFPSVITAGRGFQLVDADQIEYIDLVNNYTSLVHGNAFGPVASAVSSALTHSSAFASIHPAQIDLAENIIQRVSSINLVRFTNSGSEAAALASRIACRFTGRTEIIIASGGYHGAVAPFADISPDSPLRLVPYNDLEALTHAVSERTAAVFLEPFQGAGGVISGAPAYLQHASNLCHQHGALFVLDEVQSLRNHPGGMQAELDISPDLTLLGKVIGGGFPIGAVGGRAEVLEVTSPYTPSPLTHAGTFNGHIASAIGGLVTLEHLTPDSIHTLNRRANQLQTLIEEAGERSGTDISVTRSGSILNVYRGTAPNNSEEAAGQPAFHAALHLALLLEGVYTATRGMINLSTAIADDLIEELGLKYRRAFDRLASLSHYGEEGFLSR